MQATINLNEIFALIRLIERDFELEVRDTLMQVLADAQERHVYNAERELACACLEYKDVNNRYEREAIINDMIRSNGWSYTSLELITLDELVDQRYEEVMQAYYNLIRL